MADDLAAMKARIADEMARADLTSQIGLAITDAIRYYQNERFAFNESRDITFNTVAGTDFYGASANADIPLMFAFDYLILYIGGVPFELHRKPPIEVELFNQNGLVRGQPTRYAFYNRQIRVGPVPDAVYLLRIAGQITYAAPASDVEVGNPWMIDAEKLIRSRAKQEIMIHVEKRDAQDPALIEMKAEADDAFDNLKGLTNRLTGTGRVKPMAF